MHAQLNQFIDSLKAICKTAQHTLRREFGRITASLKAIYKTAQHTLRREFGRITASLKAICKTTQHTLRHELGRITASLKAICKTAQHTLRREFSRITASLKATCKTAQHTLRREFSRITASLKAICKTTQHTLRRELGRITASLKVIYKTAQHTLRQNVGLMVEQLERKWPELEQRCQRYTVLIRLDRPIGILLLLWPALWGLWIAAAGMPDWHVFIVFCTGVVLMRSAGCVLNDIADRDFDQHVARTKNRPLASGSISAREALVFAITIILIAFLLVLTLNRLTIQLSFIAIGLAAIYPFMKRYTYLPQFFLGLAFGWSIPMAFAAQTGNVPRVAWVLLIANVLWSVVYDTMYAMVDREDDLKIGVKSTAILFDDADRIIISIIQLLVMSALLLVGKQLEMGMFYYLGLFIASGFFLYQIRLIWNREPENCLKAFKNNNWFGMTVFIGIMLNFLFIES